jgi:uncharacterized membrane protein
MTRIIEWLLGLQAGFLGREGEMSLSFDPRWPGADTVGGFLWNVPLIALSIYLVVHVYRREGRTRRARGWLGTLRLLLLLLVILLLNRPSLTITQARVEPSVLPMMIDTSLSMKIRDAGSNSRIDGVLAVLSSDDAKLVRELSKQHQLRWFEFDAGPRAITHSGDDALPAGVKAIQPAGAQSRLVDAVRTVAADLQGQRIAGAVVFTDGRETGDTILSALDDLRTGGTRLFPVVVGSEAGLKNVSIDSVTAQESVFAGDLVNIRLQLRTAGVPAGQPIVLNLFDAGGGPILEDGKPVSVVVTSTGEPTQVVEVQFTPREMGNVDVQVAVAALEGEVDDQDNTRAMQFQVLDANIRVLYVDGLPRWEYRYLKQELIRDRTVDVSCLLTSADQKFAQEGDRPITRFPTSMEELMEYDVVLLGDVDPRQFTDSQLQMIQEWVSKRGGGFGVVAGPMFAPHAYRNTAIEPLVPVDFSRVVQTGSRGNLTEGFRIRLTGEGREHSIFRFFRDATTNDQFFNEQIQRLFWFARDAVARPGVGLVLAEHPSETGVDGKPMPLVVVGQFGAGRTLFSGIDDSWRWRYYTGEQIFNSYWVQTLRYLARGKKIGQRKLTLSAEKPVVELGETARLNVRVMDGQLSATLPEELSASIQDASGQTLRQVTLVRRAGQGDMYTGSFSADQVNRLTAVLPSPAPGIDPLRVPIEVATPRVELVDPRADRTGLSRLAAETGGQMLELAEAGRIPSLIPSAQRTIPVVVSDALWDAPLAFLLFLLLITCEWILRKQQGLV